MKRVLLLPFCQIDTSTWTQIVADFKCCQTPADQSERNELMMPTCRYMIVLQVEIRTQTLTQMNHNK